MHYIWCKFRLGKIKKGKALPGFQQDAGCNAESLTRCYFSRAVKRLTCCTPHSWVAKTRLQKRLLSNSREGAPLACCRKSHRECLVASSGLTSLIQDVLWWTAVFKVLRNSLLMVSSKAGVLQRLPAKTHLQRGWGSNPPPSPGLGLHRLLGESEVTFTSLKVTCSCFQRPEKTDSGVSLLGHPKVPVQGQSDAKAGGTDTKLIVRV